MRTLKTLTLLALMTLPLHADEVTITGRVVGPDGEAVEGAHVATRYRTADGVPWVRDVTGQDGAFTLQFDPHEPWDAHQVSAYAEGFAIGAVEVVGGAEGEIALPPQAPPVTGTIVDSDGQPIEGAKVVAYYLREVTSEEGRLRGIIVDQEHTPPSVTGSDGRFSIPFVPEGFSAGMSIEAEGYAGVSTVAMERTPMPGDDLTIALADEAIIAGRVTRDGEGAEGVTVVADSRGAQQGGSDETAADGSYEIRGLQAGNFRIGIYHPPPGRTAVPSDEVEVVAGERIDGVNIELIEGGLVRGTVTWAHTGQPVPDSRLWAYDPGRTWGYDAISDAEGQYELRLPPGMAEIEWQQGPEGARSAIASPVTIEVVPGQVASADFRVLRTRNVEVTVLSPDGTPAEGAAVYWYGDERESINRGSATITDAQGRATLTYGMQEEPWHGEIPILAEDAARELCGMTIVNAAIATDVTVRMAQAGYVDITVLRDDGAPATDGSIHVWVPEHGPSVPVDARIGADGRARLGPLPAGQALRLGTSLRDILTEPDPDLLQAPFTLEPGEVRELEPWIIAPEGLTLRGLVTDAEGAPVEGATVVCDRTVRPGNDVSRASTDTNGRFELSQLSTTGDCLVVAWGPEVQTAFAQPVDPRVAYEPTFALMPLGELDLLVVDDGEPVTDCNVRLNGGGAILQTLPEQLAFDVTTRPDEDGRVHFSGLIPGMEYSVLAMIGTPPNPERVGGIRPRLLADEGHVELTIEMMTLPEAQEHFGR